MIGPEEIRKKATAWWRPLLQSRLRGEPYFPQTLERIGRIPSGTILSQFAVHREEIERLKSGSKDERGFGYRIEYEGRNFQRAGWQEIPVRIVIDTEEDYVRFIGRKAEWDRFRKTSEFLSHSIPGIDDWMQAHCEQLTEDVDWAGVVKVCTYFMENPRPHMYLRQLPVDVHTKFVEEHEALIGSMIESLVPDILRDPSARRFAERYHLRYDEPLVRIRHLDPLCRIEEGHRDVSIPLSAFQKQQPDGSHILITENRMNFLTLPELSGAVALWSGGGFKVGILARAGWLKSRTVWYWGDIDEYGFQILHLLRTILPDVRSLLMDMDTYRTFQHLAAAGSRNTTERLDALTPEEHALYEELRQHPNRNRLEQEKIPQSYAEAVINAHVR